ncbi:DUF418 domain-containing protein [Asticcacaulis sp. 201]|uniref:DUF418 domain-containing protein n=1 Tax=Asticcacaulis sp. 201 TaxID=3028787 RepID=UPI002916F8B8|nr:DUF418 domain-containing protein [Asticcacaulis sp. 201]MDV6331768.1 DUF418 domain-containing protein [Asticcacaulis sp. 201]
MTPPAQARAQSRIQALDYIRGLSILGILLVNAIAFAQPFDVYGLPSASPVALTHDDLTTWWVIETFFKEKFITCFTLLFGVSIYLVGRDTNPNDPIYRTPLFRRLAWLILFGLIHGVLIWHGDILLSYAVTGFVFWRWQAASARRLLLWGKGLFILGTLTLLGGNIAEDLQGIVRAPNVAEVPAIVVHMRGGFWDSLGQNAVTWGKTIVPELLGFMPTTLGLMMVGLGLFKSGILAGEAKGRTYLGLIVAGLVSLILIGWQASVTLAEWFPFPKTFGLYGLANSLLCLPVALGYASALILAGRTRFGAICLYPLACAGRMAFTNYLTQSLIMTGLFYGGRGLGLFGTMNHAALVPIVMAIWAGQLVVSTIWMSLFRYGPFEWGWRCLTYARSMPLTKG